MKKIRIRVAFPVLAMAVVMLMSGRAAEFAAAMCAALLHEAAHVFAARALDIPLSGLSVDLLGARLNTDSRLISYRKEIILCAAGPAANLLSLAFVLPLTAVSGGAVREFFLVFAAASAGLGILNLLPVISFDGGRILAAVISLLADSSRAYGTVRALSFVCVFCLWSCSVYIMMKTGSSLSVFIFSVSLFARLFVPE